MELNENQVRPVVRNLARELTPEDITAISGGMLPKCCPSGGASGTANWDAGVDDTIGF